MKNCTHCGVELEKNMNFCPLCGEPVRGEQSANEEYIQVRLKEREQSVLTDYQKLSPAQKRKLFWEISGIVFLSGIFVTLIIDFVGDYAISWSRYPVAICAVLFINVSLISFAHNNYLLLFSGSFASSALLLVLLDLFTGNMDWGIKLGIPLLFGAYLIVYLVIVMIKRAPHKGLNVLAYSLLAAGLLSLCTEGFISLYTSGRLHFEWGVIVMASVLLVAGLLLFLHFRLKKGRDLKRFFHI